MALFYECMLKCARKLLDTADIVRDACLRHLWLRSPPWHNYQLLQPGEICNEQDGQDSIDRSEDRHRQSPLHRAEKD